MGQVQINPAMREAQESPTAWFVVLERARQSGDFARAAEAQRQLARLGVAVKYHVPRDGGQKAVAHAG